MGRKIDEAQPLFTISAVADILKIKPRMLRHFEEKGLITPLRSSGNRRLYSLHDIDILSYVQYLVSVKRVNVAGVLEIQRILKRMVPEERAKFMREVETEIQALPENEKQAYVGDVGEITEEVISDVDHNKKK